jgi:hypothetical protein
MDSDMLVGKPQNDICQLHLKHVIRTHKVSHRVTGPFQTSLMIQESAARPSKPIWFRRMSRTVLAVPPVEN